MATICSSQGSRVPAQRHLPSSLGASQPACVCIKRDIPHPLLFLSKKPFWIGSLPCQAAQGKSACLSAPSQAIRDKPPGPRGEGPLHPQAVRLNGLSGSPGEKRNSSPVLLRPAGPQAKLLWRWWKKAPCGRKTWGPAVPPALQAATGL